MLNALELLHYSHKFRNRLFAFYFQSPDDCQELLTDLRLLHTANIRQLLFSFGDPDLVRKLELWNRSGQNFLVLNVAEKELRTAAFMGQLQRHLNEGSVPLVLLPVSENTPALKESVVHCAVAVGATKVFFPAPNATLHIEGKTISCPSPSQLEQVFSHDGPTNYSIEELRFLIDQQALHRVELVRVEVERGAVFREVFTHFGSGTLFTKEYPDVLRQAHKGDVLDILAIMQPYVREGTLKQMSEDEVLDLVESFTLYTVNEQIVALAALLEYDDCFELGKLCTLPRYQARGRARKLVRELMRKTRDAGKRGLFALTVNPSVGDFFEQLGFRACSRECLPKSWQTQYDFSRPSTSYWLDTGQTDSHEN